MNAFTAALATGVWLGLLTSISPCPLATNIAAVSYLSRRMHSRRQAVLGALAYAVGRASVYVVAGLAVAWGVAAAPALSARLQSAVVPFVGPLLILVGLVLLGWLRFPVTFGSPGQHLAEKLGRCGVTGEFLLGGLFALSFCPASAALFFGALLPVAVASRAPLPVIAFYGVATALPVGILAVLVAVSANTSRAALDWVRRSEGRIQTVTATLMILVGIWLTLGATFGLFA